MREQEMPREVIRETEENYVDTTETREAVVVEKATSAVEIIDHMKEDDKKPAGKKTTPAKKTTTKKATSAKKSSSRKTTTTKKQVPAPEEKQMKVDNDPVSVDPNRIDYMDISDIIEDNIQFELDHLQKYGVKRIDEAIRRAAVDGLTAMLIQVHNPTHVSDSVAIPIADDPTAFIYRCMYPYSVAEIRRQIVQYLKDKGMKDVHIRKYGDINDVILAAWQYAVPKKYL